MSQEIKENSPISTEIKINNKSDTMERVFDAARNILDTLQDGEKILIKDLTDKVVAKTQAQTSVVSGLISMFVHEMYDGIVVERGRNGGIFKGGKKVRVDMRPRCSTCNQVLSKHSAKNIPDIFTGK